MGQLSRREFLKLCTTAAAVIGGSKTFSLVAAEALEQSSQPVIWVQGAGCAGCSSSLLNSVDPGLREILDRLISLKSHPGLTEWQGMRSVQQTVVTARENEGNFILVVEGAVPTAAGGRYFLSGTDEQEQPITLLHHIEELGSLAKNVIALGSCASFGGLPAAEPNRLKIMGLDKILTQNKVINLPGCPPHPDWVVGTLAHLALYGFPEVDDFGRPKVFYKGLIHNNCPLRQYFDNSIFASSFGEEGCLLYLGCKGPLSHGDCPARLWNKGNSWCVNAGAPCLGCTEPVFPNLTMPFYTKMTKVDLPGITSTADKIGIAAGVATGVGLAAHLAGSAFSGRLKGWGKKDGESRDG